MSRAVTEEDLQAFVDGRLSPRRRDEICAYLDRHPEHAIRVADYIAQREALERLHRAIALEEDTARFHPELLRAVERRLARARRTRRLAAASLALVLLAAGAGWQWMGSFGTGTPSQRMTLAESEIVFDPAFAPEPQDTPPAEVDSVVWLDRHLSGQRLRRPELEELGLRFVGGVIVKRSRTPAIRLLYADEQGKKIYIFVGLLVSEQERVFGLVPRDYVSLQWRKGPVVFALMAPSDSPQLVDVMEAVSASVFEESPGENPPDPVLTPAQGDPEASESGQQPLPVPVPASGAESGDGTTAPERGDEQGMPSTETL